MFIGGKIMYTDVAKFKLWLFAVNQSISFNDLFSIIINVVTSTKNNY